MAYHCFVDLQFETVEFGKINKKLMAHNVNPRALSICFICKLGFCVYLFFS